MCVVSQWQKKICHDPSPQTKQFDLLSGISSHRKALVRVISLNSPLYIVVRLCRLKKINRKDQLWLTITNSNFTTFAGGREANGGPQEPRIFLSKLLSQNPLMEKYACINMNAKGHSNITWSPMVFSDDHLWLVSSMHRSTLLLLKWLLMFSLFSHNVLNQSLLNNLLFREYKI